MGLTLEPRVRRAGLGVRSAEDALRTILAKTTDANVRANALAQLALTVGQDAESARRAARKRRRCSRADREGVRRPWTSSG
jgi:hypothetical protein